MRRLTDGERDIIRELNDDAAECERAWGRELTEDELEEICESYNCLEDVADEVFGSDDFLPDDTQPF